MDRVLAISGLRFRLMRRSVAGRSGAVSLISSILSTLIGVGIAVGMALGFGILLHVTAGTGDRRGLLVSYSIVFYVFFLLGILLPVITGTKGRGFDARPFVIFPIGRLRLYGLTVASAVGSWEHLIYYPALVTIGVIGGLQYDAHLPRGLTLIFLVAAFYVIWGHALVLFLGGIMRTRRMREIIAVVSLLLLIVVSLVPTLVEESLSEDEDGLRREKALQVARGLEQVLAPARFLPPSLAAAGLADLHGGKTALAGRNTLILLVWNSVGVLLGYLVFTRYHLAESGSARGGADRRAGPGRGRLGGLLTLDNALLRMIPMEVRAVAAKDLHYLFRSVVGKFNLLVMPIFVAIVAFLVARKLTTPVLGIRPDRVVLYGMLVYTTLFSNNFMNNAFAWEGSGASFYLMSPVPLQRVLAGKNLAVWLYNVLLFALCIVAWSVSIGFPDPRTLLTGTLLFAVSILSFTMVGNFVSIWFPVSRDIAAMSNTPASVALLLSMLLLMVVTSVASLLMFIPSLLGLRFLQPVLLTALLAVLIGVYSLALRSAARLWAGRMEKFIDRVEVLE